MTARIGRIRVPILLLVVFATLVLAALAAKTELIGPSRGGSLNNSEPAVHPTDFPCPPKSVYGVGEPPDAGCQEIPPPGQEDKEPPGPFGS